MKALYLKLITAVLWLLLLPAYAQDADGEWQLPREHSGLVSGIVKASTIDANGNLYAGGLFTTAAGRSVSLDADGDVLAVGAPLWNFDGFETRRR